MILANNIQSETIAGRVNKVVNTSIGFDINRKGGFTAIYIALIKTPTDKPKKIFIIVVSNVL